MRCPSSPLSPAAARPLLVGRLALVACLAACSTPLPKLTDTSDGPTAVDPAGSSDDDAVDTGFSGGSGGDGSAGDGGSEGTGDGGDGGDDAGDGAGDDGGDEGGDDGGVELAELSIDSVSPDYGLTSGGDTVTISGGPFDASATVRIGGGTAVVVSSSATALVVNTPVSATPGDARITVTTDTHTGTEPGLFTYFLDGRGYPGAVGVVQWFASVGSYWSAQSGGSAGVWFTVPDTSFSWWEQYVPALDTCRLEGSYTPTSTLYLDDPGLSSITLQPSSGTSILLTAGSDGYLDNELTSAQVATGRAWSLAPLVGSGLPEETVSSFARMPAAPNVTSPTITGSGVDEVSAYFTLRWTPGGSDYVAIELYLDNGYGSTDTGGFEMVRCFVQDDGSHQIDTSQFTTFPSGVQLNMLVSLVTDRPGGKLPWSQADSRVAGMNGVLGAVFTR